MKIWRIDYGYFCIALIEGIDRVEKSQVKALLPSTVTTPVSMWLLFAKGYASGHAGEATFPEYCQWPSSAGEAAEINNNVQRQSIAHSVFHIIKLWICR